MSKLVECPECGKHEHEDDTVEGGYCITCTQNYGKAKAEIKLLKEVIEEQRRAAPHYQFHGKPDLYWKTRQVLGLRMCSLRECSGEGIIGNGFGDEYFCKCMTQTERYAYQELEGAKGGD